MNVNIQNWPFYSIQNSLALILEAQNEQETTQSCNIVIGKDINGNTLWFQITIGGISMYPGVNITSYTNKEK